LLPEGWNSKRLGDFLVETKEVVAPVIWADEAPISVAMGGRGISNAVRWKAERSKTPQQRVFAGDFVVLRQGAAGGGYAVVPEAFDRAVLSTNFMRFEIEGAVVDRDWWRWRIQSPGFAEMCSLAGMGSAQSFLTAKKLLALNIAVPPIAEQLRIVAVLEQADRAVDAATRHVTDAEALMLATVLNEIYLPKAHSTMVLGEALQREVRTVSLIGGREYPVVGVAKEGMGLVYREPLTTKNTKYRTLLRAEPWDVVVRTITAFESPVAVMGAEETGYHVSGVFLTYRVLDNADPRYLRHVFSCPPFWEEMKSRARGSVLRRKTISHSDFCAIPVPMPSLAEQQAIVTRIEKVETAVRAAETHLERLRTLRSSLLENLVSGRARLPEIETAGSKVAA
jgi:type I restriction enzyme S subunit